MSAADLPAGSQRPARRCPHCLQPVVSRAGRCTACGRPMLSRGKRAAFAATLVVFVIAFCELSVRAYFASMMGPSVFFYGTSFHRLAISGPTERSPLMRSLYQRRMRGSGDEFHNVRQHENVAGNYTKYFPNEPRFTYDADTGEVYRVTINSRGLRGPEPAEHKSPGTIRVVTLGASSTFGYHDPDDGTYPAILGRILNERCTTGTRYEVLNLGVPHLTSSQIMSLFEAEAVPLQPDVVTFYEGINDSSEEGEGTLGSPKKTGVVKDAKRWAREHLILYFLYDEVSSMRKERFDAAQVEAAAAGKPERFVANVAALNEECRRRGILFVYARQQARSLLVPREELRGLTYAQEIARVREKLEREGSVTRQEMNFLVHERVLAAADRWTKENAVPVIDVVSALDDRRDLLVSWVHLNPEGNAIVADAYAREILARTCTSARDTVARAGER